MTASTPIALDQASALLGGLSPRQFMRRHWQKKPLLVRQAIADFVPPVDRSALFALAARDDVESRLLQQTGGQWRMRHGPVARRSLPPLATPGWTLLVQGVDLHDDAVHALLQRFRFVPDARLDDLMISYASDGGGVGPHFDSYDVFLLQARGRRRWRIGRQSDLTLVEGLPVKILANFSPQEEYVLEPGDMLYLPPRWAHDGVAEGADCMTYSVGFRTPARAGLARELLARLADEGDGDDASPRYADPRQDAVDTPAALPPALLEFARRAVAEVLREPQALARSLGEVLSEPKPGVWFDPVEAPTGAASEAAAVRLDRRTRMLYDAHHVFVNGESFRIGGRDARLIRRLADTRQLSAIDVRRLSNQAQEVLHDWIDAGWLHAG